MTETNRIEYKQQITKEVDLVEQLGSGIPRILEHYKRECFHFSENFVSMVFPITEVASNMQRNQDSNLVIKINKNQCLSQIFTKFVTNKKQYNNAKFCLSDRK